MSDFTQSQIMRGINALRGQICTLSHQREIAAELKRLGYMRFTEWPTGSWILTDKGRNFIIGFGDEEAERQERSS